MFSCRITGALRGFAKGIPRRVGCGENGGSRLNPGEGLLPFRVKLHKVKFN